MWTDSGWTRRRFLVASSAGVAGLWLGGCRGSDEPRRLVEASDPSVAERERQRSAVGGVRKSVELVAGILSVDLAGRVVRTVGYGGLVPGPEIRLRAGDELEVRFAPAFNALTGETGAGKSILVDALHLVLGGRAKADSVRDRKSVV